MTKEEESEMAVPTKKGICLECGNEEFIKARGLGEKCYNRLWGNGTLNEKYPRTSKKKEKDQSKPARKKPLQPENPPLPIDLSLVPGLRDRIQERAVKQIRSIEQQIVFDLSLSYRD